MTARKRIGGHRLRSERGELRRAAQVWLRTFGGGKELAVRRERRHRFFAAGEQPAGPFLQRHVGAFMLGRDHENGSRIVGEHDMRAGAGEGAPDACAESAQAFEPGWRSGGYCRGDACDLRGGELAGVETARPISADVGAPKIAAPTGLAQMIRVASVLQSQAGNALVASGASLSSCRQDVWKPDALIPRSHPPISA